MSRVHFQISDAVGRFALAIQARLNKADLVQEAWRHRRIGTVFADLEDKIKTLRSYALRNFIQHDPTGHEKKAVREITGDIGVLALIIADLIKALPDVELDGNLTPGEIQYLPEGAKFVPFDGYDPTANLLYISGPITGLPDGNMPAFARAERLLNNSGYACINPAVYGAATPEYPYVEHLRRDFRDLLRCNGLVLLDGWQNSNGATAEVFLAKKLDMPIYTMRENGDTGIDEGSVKLIPYKETAIEEAARIVQGARHKSYGHPAINHRRTADFWRDYLKGKYGFHMDVTPEDVCWLNILQKIARQMHMPNHDNITDTIGYAANVEMINDYHAESVKDLTGEGVDYATVVRDRNEEAAERIRHKLND